MGALIGVIAIAVAWAVVGACMLIIQLTDGGFASFKVALRYAFIWGGPILFFSTLALWLVWQVIKGVLWCIFQVGEGLGHIFCHFD